MSEITIHRVEGDALRDHYAALVRYAFYPSPPLNLDDYYEKRAAAFAEQPTYVLYEDGTPVACNTALPMQHHVRGEIVAAAGIAGVVTLPQARRKGYAYQLMTTQFQRMRDDAQSFSILYPFRESFYENLGYVTFPQVRRFTFDPRTLLPLLNKPAAGHVERQLAGDGYFVYRQMQRHYLQHVHGFGMPGETAVKNGLERNGDQLWLATARDDDGQLIGLMHYRLEGFEKPMRIQNFFTTTIDGRYALLAWMARHIDQVSEIDLTLPAYERPETWLADMAIKPHPDIGKTPMGRVMDVMALAGMTVGRGRVCLRVIDPFCDWNNRVYTFVAGMADTAGTADADHHNGGILQIRAGGQVNATVTIHGLSALVYGTHSPADIRWRGWTDAEPPVLAQLARLFPLAQPYLHAQF